MTVADLKWYAHEERRGEPRLWTADTPIGSYLVERKKRYWLSTPYPKTLRESVPRWYGTLDEARAVAQADFERRVKACLTPEGKETAE